MQIGWVMQSRKGKLSVLGYLNGHAMVVAEKGDAFEWRTCGQTGTALDLPAAQRAAIECVLTQRGQS